MPQRHGASPRTRPQQSTAARRGGGARRGGDLAGRRARLREVIEPVVTGAGYDLEEVGVSRAGRRHLVRVVVDADGGIGLDAIAELSRAVSAGLDEAERSGGDLVAGEYVLEVSSPGTDRPLTLPRHWRRNIGRLVKVRVGSAGDTAARQLTGRILAADDTLVALDVDGERHEFAPDRLGPGAVQIEFARLELEDAADGEPDPGGPDADLLEAGELADGDLGDDDGVEDEER